jgi:hypothetical protein
MSRNDPAHEDFRANVFSYPLQLVVENILSIDGIPLVRGKFLERISGLISNLPHMAE